MLIVTLITVVVDLIIIKWLLNQKTGIDFTRKGAIRIIFIGIFITILDVFSGLFINTDINIAGNPLIDGFFMALLGAGLLEELFKYAAFRLAIRNNQAVHSWLDVIIVAALVAMGFDLFENFIYSVLGDLATVARAFFPMHFLFGAVMGYYFGKARLTGQFKYHVMSIGVPVLLHTLFDMWLISMKNIIGDDKIFDTLTEEQIMALPYYDYLEPMVYAALITIVVFFAMLVVAFRRIHRCSRNGELQDEVM